MENQAALNSDQEKEASAAQDVVLPAGVERVRLRVEVPEGTRLEVEIEARAPDGRILERRRFITGQAGALPGAWDGPRRFREALSRAWRAAAQVSEARLAAWLSWAALAVYLTVRLVALPAFPIYFFTDEAIQTNLAADLLRDNLRGPDRELLPAFFQNGTQYNLGASVYLQVLPYFFFGKSIWVTRGAAVLATLLAAACLGLMLKKVFHSAYPWLAVLFLSVTPVWFLHSRTAFETGLSVACFAAFLYFYLRYRMDSPRHLYAAVAFAALAFYSYSAARLVIPLAALLLLVTDWRYHWAQRAVVLRAAGLALLLALPFARFLITHPEASRWQMRLLGSVWVTDVSLLEKLSVTLREYLRGLNPLYWYLPHALDLPRHTMLGYGHLLRFSLPLALLGLGLALRNLRSPAYRVLLVAILAAPAGAAAVRLGVTRVLFMVIPAAVMAALGTEAALNWAIRRYSLPRRLLPAAVFALLSVVNGYMLYDALANGPLWYREYSLTGMQYGASQMFGEVKRYLEQQPDARLVVSPSWANGTDVVARFFFRDPLPFELGSAAGYYSIARPLEKNQVFVMIPEEFNDLPLHYFSEIQVEKTLPYPDGQPGFYFVRFQYAQNIRELIAGELEQRHALESSGVELDGQIATVRHTRLDLGELKHIFDGDPDTLVRTLAVNPMLVQVEFAAPRPLHSLELRVGGAATRITLRLWQAGQDAPLVLDRQLAEESLPRTTRFDFSGETPISRVELEIFNLNDPPEGHVHLWEISIK